jgi:hypothetical protein
MIDESFMTATARPVGLKTSNAFFTISSILARSWLDICELSIETEIKMKSETEVMNLFMFFYFNLCLITEYTKKHRVSLFEILTKIFDQI